MEEDKFSCPEDKLYFGTVQGLRWFLMYQNLVRPVFGSLVIGFLKLLCNCKSHQENGAFFYNYSMKNKSTIFIIKSVQFSIKTLEMWFFILVKYKL